ncbi:MAG: hypothetical protein KKB51_05185 [Candidatus Riflebacteria bacterium]|nr:hypothetical protein [Candidatus Riflebacteria bacterium]
MKKNKLLFVLILLASFSFTFLTFILTREPEEKHNQKTAAIEISDKRPVTDSPVNIKTSEPSSALLEVTKKRSDSFNNLPTEYFTPQLEQNTRTATKNILARTIAVMKARESDSENKGQYKDD